MPYKTDIFKHRVYFMQVRECDAACNFDPKKHRCLVQSLPHKLPMAQCLATFVTLRDELLTTSVAQQYEVKVLKADSTGKPCEHEGGEYIQGGGFAPTYKARLTPTEKPMANWLMKLFTGSETHASPHVAKRFQHFHDMLELMRRSLNAFHVLKRKKWFATPKSTPAVQVEFARMLYKCLARSQYATLDDNFLAAYRPVSRSAFEASGLRAKLTFEIVWAAICEQAQMPHEALAYHCVNDQRSANVAKQKKREAGVPVSSSSSASASSSASPAAVQISPDRAAAMQETQARVAWVLARQNQTKRRRLLYADPPAPVVSAPAPAPAVRPMFGSTSAAPSWLLRSARFSAHSSACSPARPGLRLAAATPVDTPAATSRRLFGTDPHVRVPAPAPAWNSGRQLTDEERVQQAIRRIQQQKNSARR